MATGVTEEDYGSMLVDTSIKPFVLSQFIFQGCPGHGKGETWKNEHQIHNSLICTITDTVEAMEVRQALRRWCSAGTFIRVLGCRE